MTKSSLDQNPLARQPFGPWRRREKMPTRTRCFVSLMGSNISPNKCTRSKYRSISLHCPSQDRFISRPIEPLARRYHEHIPLMSHQRRHRRACAGDPRLASSHRKARMAVQSGGRCLPEVGCMHGHDDVDRLRILQIDMTDHGYAAWLYGPPRI
jgi:hypothetical protein